MHGCIISGAINSLFIISWGEGGGGGFLSQLQNTTYTNPLTIYGQSP